MRLIIDTTELERFAERLTQQDKGLKRATKEIAQLLKDLMKYYSPAVTGKLRSGWDTQKGIRVKEVADGFEVQLVNPVEYALWVNDGHLVKNQYGDNYWKVKNRVKVPVMSQWQNVNATAEWYVFGHFFVEKSIVAIQNNNHLEEIIMANLELWLEWCCE
jgi:hypothetical protein